MVEANKTKLVKVAKGMRDMLPDQMAIKEQAINLIKHTFRKHGAVEIDTPVCERKETLLGKYGEQSKLIFDLEDQGGEQLSLRYDLTVPFARFMYCHRINKIKRFHIGKVYRRDQPNKKQGRFREFYQCDFDIAGPSLPMVADAEVLKVFVEALTKLQINFSMKLNDRRLLDEVIINQMKCDKTQFNSICSSIDKLDKEKWETVEQELIQKGLTSDQVEIIKKFVEIKADSFNEMSTKLSEYFGNLEILQEIQKLFDYLEAMGISQHFQFDTSLARGLDYYTGLIFEGVLQGDDAQYGIGSIAGGGRYDNLIGMFSSKQIPAVGGSVGIERIFNVLELRAKRDNQILNPAFSFIGTIGEVPQQKVFEVASWLWDSDIQTEVFYEKLKIGDQVSKAVERGAKCLIILGEEEEKKGEIMIKNLKSQEQITLQKSKASFLNALQAL